MNINNFLRHIFLSFILVLTFHILCGQTIIISGSVQSVIDDELLPDVTIKVTNKNISTTTDNKGEFKINQVELGDILVISHVGYEKYSIKISDSTPLLIKMNPDISTLESVVVVGYGKQKKYTLTGSISTLDGEVLRKTPVSNISNMLIGNIPGVSGVQTGGEPGRNSASIKIRGVSTYGSSTPLVVIDGVQQATEFAFSQLNNIDANEIENISVLKDAAATAVYGIRGANGVIILTTKRGKEGDPKISLSTNYGVTKATSILKTVNSYEYGVMRNEAIKYSVDYLGDNSYKAYIFSQDDLWKFENGRDYTPQDILFMDNLSDSQKEQLANSPALYYGSNDWMNEVFGGLGPQSQLNFNISGGTKKVKYFSSLGHFQQGTILKNTSYHNSNTESTFDRYNFRAGFDFNLVENLEMSVDLMGQFNTISGPGANQSGASSLSLTQRYGAITQWIYESNPFEVPGIVDGKLVNRYSGSLGTAANPLGLKTGSSRGSNNALYNLLSNGSETIYNTFLSGSINLKYDFSKITPGLSARFKSNFEDVYEKTIRFFNSIPTYTVRRDLENPNELLFFSGTLGKDVVTTDAGHNSVWNKVYFETGLEYSRSFNRHVVNGLFLANAQRFNMPVDDFNTASGLMGFVGRGTYSYDDRYLLELNLGYNGTEQFDKGRRFGFFPAYSAGWILSNERFFAESEFMKFLKIRGSYGQVGNDRLGGRRYLYLPSTYSTNLEGYYFGNSDGSSANPYYSGSAESTIGNPVVSWEKATKANIGLDSEFLDGRMSVTVDVFKEERNNILTNIETVPAVYGVTSKDAPPANVGITSNSGYEIVLGWKEARENFYYDISGNLNFAKNKVIYRAESPNPYFWMNRTGYPLGQYKGLVSDGFYNSQEELNNRPFNRFTNNIATLGDIRYVDVNGDGYIDQNDEVPIGYSNLPQYAFSLRFALGYKNFDLNVLLIGTAKGSKYLASKMQIPFYKNAGNAFKWQYDSRWTPEKVENGGNITYPRAQINGSATDNSFLTSDFWLKSTDFRRVKNLEVGYTINQSRFFDRINLNSFRLYLNGNNLFTWGNEMKDLDPEQADTGSAHLYPLTRIINFGVNARF